MLQQTKITCPICNKGDVSAIFHPPTLQIKTSRGSGQSGKITYRTEEYHEPIGDCPLCGAKQKAIQSVLNGKVTSEEARTGKKKCKFCGEMFEGKGAMCTQCKEWEGS